MLLIMRGLAVPALTFLMACGATVNTAAPPVADDAQLGDDAGEDPEIDAPPELPPFGTPVKIAATATDDGEDDGTLSNSGLELVFARQNPNQNNRKDLFYSKRDSLADDFPAPVLLAFSADGTSEETPRFSADDLTLYFAQGPNGQNLDVFRTTRPAAGSPDDFDTPELVAGINTGANEKWFMPCTGNRFLLIVGQDIAEGVLDDPPTTNAQLSSPQTETGNFLTDDCLTAYFASTRNGQNQLFRASRERANDLFDPPQLIPDFEDLDNDDNLEDPFISPDQRIFVFVSDKDGSKDLYLATR
jgi:hypothetical protein